MKRYLKNSVARFRREDSGSVTVEFVILMSVFVTILGAAVELGYMNIRHAMLERGLDTTARNVRLNTGEVPTYDQLKTSICDTAAIIPNCVNNLRLEMKVVDTRAFNPIPSTADCQNAEEEPKPLREFTNGLDNDLMLMRACLMFKPIFPTTGIASQLNKDAEGYLAMVSTSAFVQEPR